MIQFYNNVRTKQMLHFFIKAHDKEFEYIPVIVENNIINDGLKDLISIKTENSLQYIHNNIYQPLKQNSYKCTNADNLNLIDYREYVFSKKKDEPMDTNINELNSTLSGNLQPITHKREGEPDYKEAKRVSVPTVVHLKSNVIDIVAATSKSTADLPTLNTNESVEKKSESSEES